MGDVAHEARKGSPSLELEPMIVDTALELEKYKLNEADRTAHRLLAKLGQISKL